MTTEKIRLRLPDGTERIVPLKRGITQLRIPIFDRMRTPRELAELHKLYPGTDRFSPMLFGACDLADTGERDAEGRRIFA